MKNTSTQILPFDLEVILGEQREKYVDFSLPVYKIFDGWDRLLPYLKNGNYFVVFESKRKRYPFLDELLNFADYLPTEKQRKHQDFEDTIVVNWIKKHISAGLFVYGIEKNQHGKVQSNPITRKQCL